MRDIIIKSRNKTDVTDEALYALEIDSHWLLSLTEEKLCELRVS